MFEHTFAEIMERVSREVCFQAVLCGILMGLLSGVLTNCHRRHRHRLSHGHWKTVKDKLTKWTGFKTAGWLLCHLAGASLFTDPHPLLETPKPPLGSMKFLPVLREDGFLPRLAWALMTFYVALRLPSLHHGLDFREMQKICISFISVAGGLHSHSQTPGAEN